MSNLTKEIIIRIMEGMGITVPPNFGNVGLTQKELLLAKSMPIDYEDQHVECPIWAGQLNIDSNTVMALFVDFSDWTENEKDTPLQEYVLVFRQNKMPIYGLRYTYYDEKFMLFDGNWKPISVYLQARALAGMELITTSGLLWNPTLDLEDLYSAAKTLVEM